MTLRAQLLQRLGPEFSKAGLRFAGSANESKAGLGFGIADLDEWLPDQGMIRGGVVELCAAGEGSLGTSLALAACARAQAEGKERSGNVPWCAFVDASGTLYGPGVAASGVELSRLLVVRPPLDALSRVALRLAESEAFAVVVVDLAGVVGSRLGVPLGTWPRIVRRLAMAVAGTGHSIILLTREAERRPLPLPVAQRFELSRAHPDRLVVKLAKDQRGRISAPRPVVWSRSPTFSGGREHASWGACPSSKVAQTKLNSSAGKTALKHRGSEREGRTPLRRLG
jgi:recombination protein RecA